MDSSIVSEAMTRKEDGYLNLMDLPFYFMVTLLVDWLGVKGTMKLDIAMSDKEQRLRFLEMLRSGHVCFEGAMIVMDVWKDEVKEESKIPTDYLRWLLAREVGVHHVFLGRNVSKDVGKVAMALSKNSPHLRSLHFNCFEGITTYLIQVGQICKNLEELDVIYTDNVNVDAELSTSIKSMPNLKVVGLVGCRVSDECLFTLGAHCHKLKRLNVSCNEDITDKGLKALAEGCPSLEQLKLNECLITDEGITAIANSCSSLTLVDLVRCSRITDLSVNEIAMQCPLLQDIKLEGCRVSDECLLTVGARCHLLKRLNLSCNEDVTDKGLKALAKGCPLLEQLKLNECIGITDEGITAIASSCSSLTLIDLVRCSRITDLSINEIAIQCPLLQEINLEGCHRITDVSISSLSKNSHLKRIDLSDSLNITDTSIINLSQGCTNLEDVYLNYCIKLTNEAVFAIARFCSKLKVIYLSRNVNITDEAIVKLAEGCRELEFVYIWRCDNLTNESVVAFATNCPRLKLINLGRISNITDDAITHLAKGCRELETVDMWGCDKLTDVSLHMLGKYCPCLKYVDYGHCPLITQTSKDSLNQLIAKRNPSSMV